MICGESPHLVRNSGRQTLIEGRGQRLDLSLLLVESCARRSTWRNVLDGSAATAVTHEALGLDAAAHDAAPMTPSQSLHRVLP